MELPFFIEMLKTKKLQIWTGFVKALSFFPLLCFVWYSSRPRCYILYMASILRGSPRNIGSQAWYLFAWPVFVVLVFLIFLILILLKLDLWKRVVFLCPSLCYVTSTFVSENFIKFLYLLTNLCLHFQHRICLAIEVDPNS